MKLTLLRREIGMVTLFQGKVLVFVVDVVAIRGSSEDHYYRLEGELSHTIRIKFICKQSRMLVALHKFIGDNL